jgi:HPt (histidine-containing phosphotransfer) domain-containing protein
LVARTKANPAQAPRPAATPSAAAGIDDGLIDESQIEEIRAAVGDEMISELLVAFCQDVRTEFDRVIAACSAKDRTALMIATHTLRGVAGNLGAARIAKLASALESAATSDGGRVIDETLVDNLTTAVDRTIEVLSRRV